jgi:hypothetical protein
VRRGLTLLIVPNAIALRVSPKMPVPDLIRDGYRFSEEIARVLKIWR